MHATSWAAASPKSPALEPTPAFHSPEVATATLSNGLELSVVTRSEIPKVAAALVLHVGATSDPEGRPGLASMTAEMLEEGTASRSSLQIEAELDRLGSHLSGGGSREWSALSLDTLKRHLEASLELMSDVLLHPSFPGEELDRIRRLRLDGFLQDKVSPGAIAGKSLRKRLFGSDHPYGWSVGGNESSIGSMDRAELEQFYLRHYTPGNSSLIMVGDIDLEEAVRVSEEAFGSWNVEAPAPARFEPAPGLSKATYFADRPGAAQSELRLARHAPPRTTADYHVLEVLNNVLGGGFSGRLNLNLREDKGYTYGAFSSIRYGTVQSLLVGSASVESSVTKPALEELLKEFDALSSWYRPITKEELDHAKESLVRGFAQRFETLAHVAGEIAELDGFGLGPEELRGYQAAVESVTLEQLEEAAATHLSTDEAIVVVVGDREKVADEVASIGFGELALLDPDGELLDDASS